MADNTLRVAVATKGGRAIDEHFGHAKSFHVYEVHGDSVTLNEVRQVSNYCLGGHSDKTAMADILQTISDCGAVFVAKIGDGPSEKLKARGIQAITQYTWEEIIPSLQDFYANQHSQ